MGLRGVAWLAWPPQATPPLALRCTCTCPRCPGLLSWPDLLCDAWCDARMRGRPAPSRQAGCGQAGERPERRAALPGHMCLGSSSWAGLLTVHGSRGGFPDVVHGLVPQCDGAFWGRTRQTLRRQGRKAAEHGRPCVAVSGPAPGALHAADMAFWLVGRPGLGQRGGEARCWNSRARRRRAGCGRRRGMGGGQSSSRRPDLWIALYYSYQHTLRVE